MSEEEKEAIRELKHYISITPHWKLQEYMFGEVDNYIKTTLNLIDKLQKENKESKELYNKLFNGYNKLVQEHLELQKENEELKEKIENEIKELEENEDFYREHDRMYEYEGKINLLKRILAKE